MGDDVFETAETQARGTWYGVSGIPDCRIDGVYAAIGAGSCASAAATYRQYYEQRMAETSGVSPILIKDATLDIAGANATMSATFKLVDPVQIPNMRATLLLYEDDIYWCCGYGGEDTWEHVTRKIYDQNITLNQMGDEVVVTTTTPITGFDAAQLHAVAYLQRTDTKEVLQAQKIGSAPPLDYSLSWPVARVASIPQGNGIASFTATLQNLAPTNQTFTLEPGPGFGGWVTDFYVCGDNNPHQGQFLKTLAPDEVCQIMFRVQTDAAHEIRTGSFKVTSNISGRLHEVSFRVFNDSYAVLVVDDDGNHTDEVGMLNALTANGYLYEHWDVRNGHNSMSPVYANMAGFDYVLWDTSWWTAGDPLTAADVTALKQFMDEGGSFFLASQIVLNDPPADGSFLTNYLGVASYAVDKGYERLFGTAGDAIGNGLELPLTFQYPSFKKGDDLTPGPNAAVVFTTNNVGGTWRAMVRNTMAGGAKSCFMASAWQAISQTDADPNNQRVLLGRIMTWLEPESPADVPDAVDAVAGIIRANPNPFDPRTEITFSLTNETAAAPVRLAVYDLAGRQVASLFEGSLEPGEHSYVWDGTDASHHRMDSGVYFARLTSIAGTRSQKLILLR